MSSLKDAARSKSRPHQVNVSDESTRCKLLVSVEAAPQVPHTENTAAAAVVKRIRKVTRDHNKQRAYLS